MLNEFKEQGFVVCSPKAPDNRLFLEDWSALYAIA